MNKLIEVLSIYAILHITYTDLGFEIGEKHKTLIRNPYVSFILIVATVLHNYDYGRDGNMEFAIFTIVFFYALLLWGQNKISIPILDHLVLPKSEKPKFQVKLNPSAEE